MTTRDREILDKITLQIMKIRGISPPENQTDKIPRGENGENEDKIKSIPLGTYIDTEGENKARVK